ncbi:carboxymuconolactone decarboxylase family protein [Scytonema sp. NUACC21]
MEYSERYQRGWQTALQVYGVSEQEATVLLNQADALSPDLKKWLVEFAFGDVYSRPHLDLKQRHLVTLGALVTLGHTELQLSLQIKNALKLGFSEDEIIETILQCVIWVGFPRVVNAMVIARQVFEKSKVPSP